MQRAYKGFNPRPRAGGDDGELLPYQWHDKFQSTPPRGGRLRIQKVAEY